MIVLSGLFFCGVKRMKRIICMILTISILQMSVFGCFVQASGTDTSSSYNISEKQKKIYDHLYGAGNWFIDEDGTVAPVKDYNKTRDQMRTMLDRFLMKLVVSTGILGPYGDMLDMLDDLVGNQDVNNSDNLSPQANNYLNKWFSQYDDAIDVDEQGNISVGADAMQGFRSALSDQVYSLGSYRLLQQNATKKQILDFLANYSEMGALKLSDMFDSPDVFGVVAYHYSADRKYAQVTPLDSRIATEQFFISNYQFSNGSSYNFYVYDYDSGKYTSSSFKEYRSDAVVFGSTSNFHLRYSDSGLYYYGLPIKIFSSPDSAKYYYKSLRSPDYQPNVYIYNNYSPSSTTINLNNVNNYDYEKIYNNAYNTINNEKNTTIKVSGSISDNDLQLIIQNAIDLVINQTGGGNGGGSGGGSGDDGGGSGGSSGTDYTGILNSILTYCKNISAVVTSSDSRLELLVGIASENKTLISGISASITDLSTSLGDIGVSVKNIEQYLKDISDQLKDLLGDDGSGGGGSLFDRLIDFLFRTLSNLLADLLGDVIGTIIGDLGKVTGPAKGLADAAQTKFPTSIPWDIIAIIGVMSAEPECPKFEIPFSVPRLGINETIKIDLSKADKVAELSRKMLTVTFLLFLVVQTRKLYGSMNNKN